MRMVLQVLGGIWLVSMLLTISSCLYIGHVASTAASNLPSRPAVSTHDSWASPTRDDTDRAEYRPTYSPSVPNATYTPGQPMLDPIPPGEHHYR